uniref:Uncharacterized protein n=1 Tax=Trichuris muris TaxID=70415 RepID=A0A5S6R1E8_TRIMR
MTAGNGPKERGTIVPLTGSVTLTAVVSLHCDWEENTNKQLNKRSTTRTRSFPSANPVLQKCFCGSLRGVFRYTIAHGRAGDSFLGSRQSSFGSRDHVRVAETTLAAQSGRSHCGGGAPS